MMKSIKYSSLKGVSQLEKGLINKKAVFIVLMIILLTCFFPVLMLKACAQTSGLAGYWKLSEDSGNMVPDSSGNGNTGYLGNYSNSELPQWVNGINGGSALKFDGVGNFVIVSGSTNLNFSTAVTVMAWVYLPAGANYLDSRILGKDAANGGTNLDFDINDSGHVELALGNGEDFNGTPAAYSSGVIPLGAWTHVAATYDGSLAKIYINGSLDTSASWTSGFDINNGMPLCIGASNYLTDSGTPYGYSCINATIDDVRIYNTALSQQDISAIFASDQITSTPAPSTTPAATSSSPTSGTSTPTPDTPEVPLMAILMVLLTIISVVAVVITRGKRIFKTREMQKS
jgi:hypothetical protein